jgi:adiponectin receptor
MKKIFVEKARPPRDKPLSACLNVHNICRNVRSFIDVNFYPKMVYRLKTTPISQNGTATQETKQEIEETDTASTIRHSLEDALLCTIHEVESWQHDNEYLLSNYRRVSNSYHACLSSLGYLHNQTGNIYSHLVGVALFLAWAIQTYNDLLTRYPTSTRNDILAFGTFFAGALICFGLSATFHTLGSHSQPVYHNWLLLDLYGIFAIIIGTVYSGTYYGFYCERMWWRFYSVGVSKMDPFPSIITVDTEIYEGKINIKLIADRRHRHHMRNLLHKTPIPETKMEKSSCNPLLRNRLVRSHPNDARGTKMEQVDAQMGWNLLFLEGLCYITGAIIYAVSRPSHNTDNG